VSINVQKVEKMEATRSDFDVYLFFENASGIIT
jgi:hypothetical protein